MFSAPGASPIPGRRSFVALEESMVAVSLSSKASPRINYAAAGVTTQQNEICQYIAFAALAFFALALIGCGAALATDQLPFVWEMVCVGGLCVSFITGLATIFAIRCIKAVDDLEEDGKTKIMQEVEKGNIVGIKWLLLLGANPLTKGRDGLSAKDYAKSLVDNGDEIRALLETGYP